MPKKELHGAGSAQSGAGVAQSGAGGALPTKVFGALHGQLSDLLSLFR